MNMPYTSPCGIRNIASAMSVPEHVRYRNSTMFVGTPPFGYEGTDDWTSPFWHPPMTPPHEMRHRTMNYPSVLRPTTSNRNTTPVTSDSLKAAEQEAPEFVMTDVVPALFSSPKIGPHLAQCIYGPSDRSRLDTTHVQQAVESGDEIPDTRRDSMIGITISNQGRHKVTLMWLM